MGNDDDDQTIKWTEEEGKEGISFMYSFLCAVFNAIAYLPVVHTEQERIPEKRPFFSFFKFPFVLLRFLYSGRKKTFIIKWKSKGK